MVAEAVKWGFKGIKVHGYDAMPTREVCEAAQRYSLPVLVDVIGQAAVVEMLASEFPQVNFVIPHLGSFRDDWRAHQQVLDQLQRHANVYADTSGVRRFDYLTQAVQRGLVWKLIFGSDGPWLHPGLELHKIRLLGLAPDDEAAVLGGNARRLLAGAGKPRSGRPVQTQNQPGSVFRTASPAPAAAASRNEAVEYEL